MDSESYHLLSDIVKAIGETMGGWPVVVFVRPQTEVGDDILGYLLGAIQRGASPLILSLSATSFRPELGLRVVDHLYRLKGGFKFVVNGPCFGGTNLVACGAETLCFTQTGEMGLWWGSINTPWNPVDESHRYLPLDVDVILGYLELLERHPQSVEPITRDVSPLAVSAAYNSFKRTVGALEALERMSPKHKDALRAVRQSIQEDYSRASLPWGPGVAASFGFDVQTFDAALEKLFNDVNAKVFSEAFVPQRQGSAENYSVTVPDVMIVDSSAVLLHTTYIEGMVMDTEVEERPVGADWRTVFFRG
ncbi:MAG TPA: hypothetical protein DCR68_02255 [Coprothermobacter sp.]|jgi:hypothetical protein|nr:hypothetical protein [Coprothermobacter sp.]